MKSFEFINIYTKKKNPRTSYVDFLELIALHIESKDSSGKLALAFNDLTKAIIEKEKKEKPYFNVDDKERRVLLAIENGIDNNEKISIKKILKI